MRSTTITRRPGRRSTSFAPTSARASRRRSRGSPTSPDQTGCAGTELALSRNGTGEIPCAVRVEADREHEPSQALSVARRQDAAAGGLEWRRKNLSSSTSGAEAWTSACRSMGSSETRPCALTDCSARIRFRSHGHTSLPTTTSLSSRTGRNGPVDARRAHANEPGGSSAPAASRECRTGRRGRRPRLWRYPACGVGNELPERHEPDTAHVQAHRFGCRAYGAGRLADKLAALRWGDEAPTPGASAHARPRAGSRAAGRARRRQRRRDRAGRLTEGAGDAPHRPPRAGSLTV